MENPDDSGMDTTYVTIMLVVFLVLTGLAIDIGYMYVSEEDLQGAAETAALTGAQSIKQRLLQKAQTDPDGIAAVAGDAVQGAARKAAIEAGAGKHDASALVGLATDNGNALSGDNDITVGFWNVSSRSYTPGGSPVNAMQVRTRRTAESSSVGMGSLGAFMAKITGTESFGVTPVAIAALPAGTRSNVALCSDVCDSACVYPKICSIPERQMSRAPWDPRTDGPAANRYLYTSLLHPVTITNTMSDMVCQEMMPTQEVCGRPIFTAAGTSDDILRDLESMMYNPQVDRSNKEYDASGKLVGWWVTVPVVSCGATRAGDSFEQHSVTKYSLVRISRICVGGAPGCRQTGATFDAPAGACGPDRQGLYIDRISCVDCGSKTRIVFPGLHPVLVH